MISFYLSGFRTARFEIRRLRAWARRHPRWSAAIGVISVWIVLSIIGASAAFADNGTTTTTLPFLPPSKMQDSSGVSLTQYAILPLDRGDAWTWSKGVVAFFIDIIWMGNIIALGWMLWLFQWLLSFEWVSWLATPLNNIATLIQSFLGQTGWIPLALVLTAGVAGMAMLSGRYVAGGTEILISVICSVLAVGILANPVQTLTGDNGALAWSQKWGANLAAGIADNKISAADPSLADAQRIISDTITGELMDTFVRRPAELIAFGHQLSGDCEQVFSDQMKAASPIDTGSTTVRDRVGDCDSEAKTYVTHPNVGQIWTTANVAGGSLALFTLGLCFAVLLFMAVLYSIWQGMKTMGAVYLAVAPGVGREALWKAFIGMYLGAFSVGVFVVILSAYLRILIDVLKIDMGLNIVGQTMIINFVILALVVSLLVFRHRAKKAGETVAKRLARLGLRNGSGQQRTTSPLKAAALNAAGQYAAHKLSSSPTRKALPATPAGAEAAPLDAGHMTATTIRPDGTGPRQLSAGAPKGGPGSPGVASKAIGAAMKAGELGLAAYSGGTSAVVLKASKMAGKTVLQRHVDRALNAGRPVTPEIASSRPDLSVPFGRQIVVDADGTGHIAPIAPQQGQVYNVTSLPAPAERTQSVQRMRAALERASRVDS